MGLKKGMTNNPNGRPAGVPNKNTGRIREAVAELMEIAAPKLTGWLDKIEQEHGALEAFKRVEALLEYTMPKLQRGEVQNLDANGNPADPLQRIEVHFIKSDKRNDGLLEG